MKKYKKVVEWEKDELGFLLCWFLQLIIFIFFPIHYITTMRKVYYVDDKKTFVDKTKQVGFPR